MTKGKNIYILTIVGLATFMLSSCREDYTGVNPANALLDPISFDVSLVENGIVDTRADNTGNPGLDSIYVAYNPWNQDFYIQLNTVGENGEDITEYGVYGVPSAYEGRLDSKNASDALNWKNLDKPHTFYSWTIPWMTTDPKYTGDSSDSSGKSTGTGTGTETYYIPSNDTIPVYFYNSSEEYGFEKNKNNAIYEGFIGAKSEPYTYVEHGKYVELTFHHLVSRIKIESLILIQTDGSVQKDLQADMTFVNMPIKGTFYPNPSQKMDPSELEENNITIGWRPYVGAPYVNSPDTGVTYYIKNKADNLDLFYICPEVNFADIHYQIKINSEGYETLKTYYGTFDDVVFERTPAGLGYNRPDETHDYDDSKILHAGEEMRLSIVLIPGKGPGLKVIIEDWSTEQPVESQYHSHPGFYSDAELQQMLDELFSFGEDQYNNPPPELDLLFEMYGYEENGKKYFPLYENMTPRKGNSVSNIFPVPPGYIIDGMGHTVTLKTNWGNYWGIGSDNYFNIGGEVRDIYFTDENGEHTIYIDVNGYIWVTNSQGVLERTDNKIPPDDKPANTRGYDISCSTGKVRPTTYYNDHLGS